MDWFQSVVLDYLRKDRSMFLNPECLIRLDPEGLPVQGRHWYCDAMAVHFKRRTIFLCEITYATRPVDLIKRLRTWSSVWSELRAAVLRESGAPQDWDVCVWAFLPQANLAAIDRRFPKAAIAAAPTSMPRPRLTALEDVVPWRDNRPEHADSW